jgi:hypothetical protein
MIVTFNPTMKMSRTILSTLTAGVMMCFTSQVWAGGAGDDPGTDTYFRTPSKNIGCVYISGEGVLICERIKPKYARVQIVNKVEWLDETGGHYTANEPTAVVLGYGQSWKTPHGDITCKSKASGLTCRSIDGFGFSISKSRVSSFDPKGHEIK